MGGNACQWSARRRKGQEECLRSKDRFQEVVEPEHLTWRHQEGGIFKCRMTVGDLLRRGDVQGLQHTQNLLVERF